VSACASLRGTPCCGSPARRRRLAPHQWRQGCSPHRAGGVSRLGIRAPFGFDGPVAQQVRVDDGFAPWTSLFLDASRRGTTNSGEKSSAQKFRSLRFAGFVSDACRYCIACGSSLLRSRSASLSPPSRLSPSVDRSARKIVPPMGSLEANTQCIVDCCRIGAVARMSDTLSACWQSFPAPRRGTARRRWQATQ
jgi:hypothetical protein